MSASKRWISRTPPLGICFSCTLPHAESATHQNRLLLSTRVPLRGALRKLIGGLLLTVLGSSAAAQDYSALGQSGKASRKVSPVVLRSLASQDESRARLLPLHASSILEWMCGDVGILAQMQSSRQECYRELYKTLPACQSQTLAELPVGRSQTTTTGRPDIVEFRARFGACVGNEYAARQAALGRPIEPLSPTRPDPLAGRMGGQGE